LRFGPRRRGLRPQRLRLGATNLAGGGLGPAAARPFRAQIHRFARDVRDQTAERVKLDRHRPLIIGRAAPAVRWPAAPEGSPEIAQAGLKSMHRLVDQVNSRVTVVALDPED
jgi:hypothetical protein